MINFDDHRHGTQMTDTKQRGAIKIPYLPRKDKNAWAEAMNFHGARANPIIAHLTCPRLMVNYLWNSAEISAAKWILLNARFAAKGAKKKKNETRKIAVLPAGV